MTSMKETMNEEHVEYANKMGEYDMSYETDLRFSSPKLDVYCCVFPSSRVRTRGTT